MKTSHLKQIVILGLVLLGVASSGLAAALRVERVQRDFQIRHHLVKGEYVDWPKCNASDTPAPKYPKDGFYGDITQDPDRGVELVNDLVQKFYSTAIIYTDFVDAPNGESDLEGDAEIVAYTADDMQVIGTVTTANYMQKLRDLETDLAKLKLIKVQANQIIEANDERETLAENTTGSGTCTAVQDCVALQHPTTPWGKLQKYGPSCVSIPIPFAYYKLDELITAFGEEGSAKDEIENRYLFGYELNALWTPAKIDNGFYFYTLWTGFENDLRLNSIDDEFDFYGSSWTCRFWIQRTSPDPYPEDEKCVMKNFSNNTPSDGWEIVQAVNDDGYFTLNVYQEWDLYASLRMSIDPGVHRIIVGVDENGNRIFGCVDGGQIQYANMPPGMDGMASTGQPFLQVYGYNTFRRYDELGFWKHAFTQAQADADWNSGDGITYPSDLFPSAPRTFTKIGRHVENARNGSSYFSAARNTRGKIRADLSAFESGTAKVFLKLGAVPSTDSILYPNGLPYPHTSEFTLERPTSPTQAGVYGKWSEGDLTLGDEAATSAYVNYSDVPPPKTGDCEPNQTVEFHGWQVEDALAIVAPDFTTTPDPQDCCGCENCEPGSLSASVQSVHIDIGLGADNFGSSAGSLTLSADKPSPSLTTLGALRYSRAANVDVRPPPPSPPVNRLQFKTSQSLVDIQVNNAYKYTLSVYSVGNFGPPDAQGFYQVTGPVSSTIVVENPDASPTVYNRLKITRTKGGSSSVREYVYTAATGQWELKEEVNLRIESRSSTWDAAQTIRTETVTIKDGNNQITYKERNTYQRFPWGQERVEQVKDPDGAALTSTWSFYSNPATDGSSYGRLKQEVDSSGHWTRYEYDASGRENKRVTQFRDEPVGSAENLNRVTTTLYSATDPQITIAETLLGQVVGRRYQKVLSGEVRDIVCQSAGALWNDAANMVTITKRFTSGTFKDYVQSVEHPDGTMQIYAYVIDPVLGRRTETVDSGQPNAGKTAIIAGTRTVTVKGHVGQLISRTVSDIASTLTLATESYSDLDEFNRPRRVDYMDGTFSTTTYGCCGIDSTTDRDGVQTTYLYDGLKRQDGYIQHLITIRNTLDPEGRILVTKRTGTDSSQIVTYQAKYDLAGRLSSETNALLGRTTIAESFNGSGQLLKTFTYPDGGTRIERYHKDGSLAEVSGTAAYPMRYEYGVEFVDSNYRVFAKEIKVAAGGGENEWTKTYADFAGRTYKTVYSSSTTPNPTTQLIFNNKNQLIRQIDPDSVSMVYEYNPKGEQDHAVQDMNRNGVKDATTAGALDDRITQTVRDVTTREGYNVNRTRTYVWTTEDNGTANLLVSTIEAAGNGLRTWETIHNGGSSITRRTEVQIPTPANNWTRTVTQFEPDNSRNISVFQSGRLISVTRKDSADLQIGQTIYGYDKHGRQNTTTDARNGTTTYTFNNSDQVTSVTTPAPGNGQPAQTTTTYFNKLLQATNVTYADGTSVTNFYTLKGELLRTVGSRTYPVGYTYDSQGRVTHMTNWSSFSTLAGARVTLWNYNAYRGWLDNKRYPDASTGLPSGTGSVGPDYTYKSSGRLETRTWARGTPRIQTTYAYNNMGELESVSYNDGATPPVSYSYDRRGRQTTVIRNSITTTLGYNDANQLISESYAGYPGGTLSGLSVTLSRDSLMRRSGTSVGGVSGSISVTYGYDDASRLRTVSDGSHSATYTYVANSPLVDNLLFKQGAATRMTTTKQHDNLNRLSQISFSVNSSSSPHQSFGYTHNNVNQRVRTTLVDGSYWVYEYDKLGQVTSGKRYWSDGTPVSGQQFEYGLDDIGNRTSTKAGGDSNGGNLRSATYTADRLNRYSSRTVPGVIDVLGAAKATASVTVNSVAATTRKIEYYHKEVSVANASVAIWQSVTVTATEGANNTTVTGNTFIPQTPENFDDPGTPTINEGYDLDGNQLRDGRWTYTWDAENRLTKIEANAGIPDSAKKKVECEYDWRGRRIRKKSYNWNAGWILNSDLKFLYDDWNPVVIADSANVAMYSFAWGTDLSGSMQGAGGVGGLISIKVHSGANSGTYSYAYDGNGNVVALINAANGDVAAQYEYGPFSEVIRATGPVANVNPFRFSTKFIDDETDLVYYGYRYYNASTGRWLSREPLEENVGVALYGFVANNPFLFVDTDGRQVFLAQPVQGFVRVAGEFGFENFKVPPQYYGPLGNQQVLRPVGLDVTPPIPLMPNPQLISSPTQASNPQPGTSTPQTAEDNLPPGAFLYRAMTEDRVQGGPLVGESARTLGVRPRADVEVTLLGLVNPKNSQGKFQGMSVSPDKPNNLFFRFRPKELIGPIPGQPPGPGLGKDPVWRIRRNALGGFLDFHQDSPTHGVIYSKFCVKYEDYKRNLEATRLDWKRFDLGPFLGPQ